MLFITHKARSSRKEYELAIRDPLIDAPFRIELLTILAEIIKGEYPIDDFGKFHASDAGGYQVWQSRFSKRPDGRKKIWLACDMYDQNFTILRVTSNFTGGLAETQVAHFETIDRQLNGVRA